MIHLELRALLSGSEKHKLFLLTSTIMEDEFVDLLMTIEGGEPSQELFSLLFDLLIENSSVSAHERSHVAPSVEDFRGVSHTASSSSSSSSSVAVPSNGRLLDFFQIFFEVIRRGRCDSSIQSILLRKLNTVVSTSTRVQAYCSDRNTWIYRLLKMLPNVHDPIVRNEVIQLVSTVGCFNLSVLDLKSIFALLKASRSEGSDGDRLWPELLEVLHCFRKKSGPSAFYDMDGVSSGITLSPVNYWPGKTYSFAAWIRIESFSDPSGGPTSSGAYRPSLFFFGAESGEGALGVFFHDQRLYIECNGNPPVATKLRFDPRRWYFVVLAHSYFLLAKDELRVYVDGALTDELKCPYPKTNKPFTRCVLGNNENPVTTNQLVRPQPFFGQIARIFFFSEVLSPENIKAMHLQGPDQPTLYSDQGEPLGGQHSMSFYFSKKKSAKLFFALDPRYFSDTICVETTSLDNGERLDKNATKRLGTREVITTSLKDALSCAGGVQTILPLYAHLTPANSSQASASSASSSPAPSQGAVVPSATPTLNKASSIPKLGPEQGSEIRALLELTGHLLHRTPVNQLAMSRNDAFAIIGSFFRKSDPSAFTPGLIHTLDQFAQVIRANETLYKQFYRNILLDFSIWTAGEREVQEALVEVLRRHIERDPGYYRRLVTVRRLVDALWTYYWYKEPPPSDDRNSLAISVPVQPMPLPVVRRMRVYFLQLIKQLTNNQPDLAETQALVVYLHNCSDPDQLIDVLQMLLSMFESAPTGFSPTAASSSSSSLSLSGASSSSGSSSTVVSDSPELVQHLLRLGGLNIFLGLLHHENQVVRVWSIKCVGKLLQLSTGKTRADLLADNSVVGMKKLLQFYPFTEPIYTSVLEVLVERINPIHIRDPTEIDAKASLQFKHPEMVATIFELTCIGGQVQLQHRALKTFYDLLALSPFNRSVFLRQNNWVGWLLGILANPQADDLATEGDQDLSEASDNYLLVVRLIALLLHHAITMTNGWHLFYQAHAMIVHFDSRGALGAFDLIRKIHATLLSHLTANNFKGLLEHVNNFGGVQSPGWTNIVRWIGYLDQQLFCGGPAPPESKRAQSSTGTASLPSSTIQHNLHRDAEGQWLDFQLAQKILDLLDHLLILQPTLVQQYNQWKAQQAQAGGRSGSSSSLPVPVAEIVVDEETLGRNALRLTLFTLCETDSFLKAEKTQEKGKNLRGVEKIVEDRFPSGRIRSTLSGYLRTKLKQWNEDVANIRAIYQRNVSRLNAVVKQVIDRANLSSASEFQIWRVFYVLFFLFMAMKRSYETQGEGKDIVLPLFQRILLLGRHLMPFPMSMRDAQQDALTTFTMTVIQRSRAVSGPNPPDPPPDSGPLMQCLDAALSRAAEEDLHAAASSKDLLRQLKESTRTAMMDNDERELQAKSLFAERFDAMMQKWRSEESDRRAGLRAYTQRRNLAVEQRWKKILREISHPRGSWPLHPNQVEHISELFLVKEGEDVLKVPIDRIARWKLSKSEMPSRMRLLLKRNYKFDTHEDSIRDFEQPRLFSTPPAAPSKEGGAVVEGSSDQFNSQLFSENVVHQQSAQLILPMQSVRGQLLLTTHSLYFVTGSGQTRQWQVQSLRGLYRRRFLLCDVALELFFIDDRICFVAFDTVQQRNDAYNRLVQFELPSLEASSKETGFLNTLRSLVAPPTPANLIARSGLTEKWRRRKISNFEYLMQLNTYSGRTYADLTQYPVFPWILNDYTSETINLSNPAIYRDLSKPVGILSPGKLEQVIVRYDMLDDPTIPKFHHGSHYSNIGTVLFYLLRMEPFTTHAIQLQGGYFDHENRMFNSIAQAWNGVWTNHSDNKELVPEFFYQPEFLLNNNFFRFGKEQMLHHVQLPPWANGDPWEFVKVMRDALESEIVSAALHQWIDLIWGYKQGGRAAEEAFNVFYYTTYEANVPVDANANDPNIKPLIDQIKNFGQTPSQLFTKQHPRRMTLAEYEASKKTSAIPHSFPPTGTETVVFNDPVVFIRLANNKLTACSSNGQLAVINFTAPFTLDMFTPTKRPLDSPLKYTQESIACTRSTSHRGTGSTSSPLLFICHPWEQSVAAKTVSSGSNAGYKWIKSASHHKGAITCLALAKDDRTLVTGSEDCTVMLWKVSCKAIESASVSGLTSNGKDSLFKPVTMLYGHDRAVTAVAVSSDLGVCVSGSRDGTVILHDIRKHHYIRTVRRVQSIPASLAASSTSAGSSGSSTSKSASSADSPPITIVSVSPNGLVASYATASGLQIHSVNGGLLASFEPSPRTIYALCFAFDGRYLAIGGDFGAIHIFSAHSLKRLHSFPTSLPEGVDGVRSITFTEPDEEYLFIGYSNGKVSNFPFNPLLFDERWRERSTPARDSSSSNIAAMAASSTPGYDDDFTVL